MVRSIIGAKTSAVRVNEEGAGSSAAAARPAVRRLHIDEDAAGQRLDNYLMRVLKGVPKTHVYRVIRSGEVRVNKGRAHADTRLEIGDEVRLPPVRIAERMATGGAARASSRCVYEDEHLIAIDKPAGVAVHGGSGVSSGVIEQLRRARPRDPLSRARAPARQGNVGLAADREKALLR